MKIETLSSHYHHVNNDGTTEPLSVAEPASEVSAPSLAGLPSSELAAAPKTAVGWGCDRRRWCSNAQRVFDHFVLRALRLACIECSIEDVSHSAYKADETPLVVDKRELDEAKVNVLEGYVAGLEATAKTRHDRVESKLKMIISSNTLAFALISGLSMAGKPVFLIAAVPLIVSSVLALRALGVKKYQQVSLTDADVGMSCGDLRKALLNGRSSASTANEYVINFMVDCFRAAHRYFVLALLLVPLLYGASWCFDSLFPDASGALLRGPQGDVGAVGPQGIAGPAGPPGPTGPPGPVPLPAVAEPPR